MTERATFGPAGNSASFTKAGFKSSYQAPAWLESFGLDAYEYAGGNGIKGGLETFAKIGEEAKKHNISLSLHTPYFISLSGIVEETRLKSLEYIDSSLQAAEAMGAYLIVIHSGSASKITREQAVDLAKDTLYKALERFSDTKVQFGIETMGKKNQLGTLDEVLEICSLDKRLHPVVDFGHINAREGGVFYSENDYKEIFDRIGEKLGDNYAKYLHCHFSKIEYTSAGEKCHLTFDDTIYGPPFEPLMRVIADNKLCPRIICESAGTMAEDAKAMKDKYLEYLGV